MSLPPLGLYIHLPWCERKCPYCDFNSHQSDEIPESKYIVALLADLQQDAALANGRSIQTLFIGGGTPSLFSPEGIDTLLRGIGELLPLSKDLEATMEANPGSAETDKFRDYRQAGINRLSLGIQSFNDACLQSLGRIHNCTQAKAAISAAQAAGFNSINIDLMHGLPGQSIDSAINDLKTAIYLRPEHLSWYQLTIEPNTVFYKRPPTLPLEDELADIQSAGETLLSDAGYGQYEVSAYSQPGFQCRHNLNYWSFGDYLAIGAGAHGKITGPNGEINRYSKTRMPEDYLAAKTNRTADSRTLDVDEVAGEFMLNALRLNRGFTVTEFEAATGIAFSTVNSVTQSLTERGLLEHSAGRIHTAALGRRFLDNVVAEYFGD